MTEIIELTNRDSLADFRRKMLLPDAEVCFDLETQSDTSSLEDWHPHSRIVAASFALSGERAWVVPLSHPSAPWSDDWRKAADWLFGPLQSCKLIGHGVKYDVRWIGSTSGVDLSQAIYWDTMASGFLRDENQPQSLKDSAVRELDGVERWDEEIDVAHQESEPWEDVATYAGKDAAYTFRLFQKHRDELRDNPGLAKVMWYVLMPAIRTLTRVEWGGLKLDLERVQERRDDFDQMIERIYWELDETIPDDVRANHQPTHARLFEVELTDDERLSWAPTSLFFKEYAEDRWPVLETTDKGNPSWDSSVMTRLSKDGCEAAEKLLDYRSAKKKLNAFLKPWPELADEDDRLHATFRPTGAVTGRLSCSNPNLQQVDRKLKDCFISPEGWRFVQVDYSQLEVRIVAHESGDRNLTQLYREGRDVYEETAARINDKAPDEVTPDERQRAKPVVLGFLYGMGAKSFTEYARDVYGVTYTRSEAEEVRRVFLQELFPGITDWHERQRRRVRQHGYVKSALGRVRRLPEIRSGDKAKRWGAERQAINSPVQGFASDLMLLSLTAVDQTVTHSECRQVGTVHDSALMEVRNDVVKPVVEKVGEIMLNPDLSRFGVELRVPLAVDFEIGDRWGDYEKVIEMSGVAA